MTMADNRFDEAARYVARLDPSGFLDWLMPGFTACLRFLRWLGERTTPLPGQPEQVGDTVAELAQTEPPGPPWLFPVEFQTEPDARMFGRLLRQLGSLWEEHRPDPLPDSRYQLAAGVVNLTGTSQSAPASRTFRLPLPEPQPPTQPDQPDQPKQPEQPERPSKPAPLVGLTLSVAERYLAEGSAAATLQVIADGKVARSILALGPLMQGGSQPGIISTWKVLAAAETDVRKCGDLGALVLVLAELTDGWQAWQEALKGWNMRESQTVLGWIKEGRKEGQLDTLKDNLRMLLQEQCGPLPQEWIERIAAVDDPERLKAALPKVLHIRSLDEFTL
jgi:hypothetical protein